MSSSEESYAEFERKVILFEDGPTTTNFQQLLEAGIELPEPDSIEDGLLSTTVWHVIGGLAKLRVFLHETDHLSDRELYRRLWLHTLREPVPAIDEISFNSHVLMSQDDDDTRRTHLKYYADQRERDDWRERFPDDALPPPEELPYYRDWRLPSPSQPEPAEALKWLRRNRNSSAFATNRFGTTSSASRFVEQLHAAGATRVMIENVCVLRVEDEGPYADAMTVWLPVDGRQRRATFNLIEEEGRPDNFETPLIDCGQDSLWLWWD